MSDLVGNQMIISLMKKGIKNRKFPKISLISGIHGIGKSSSAELIAMALTCDNPVDGEACRECDTCKKNIAALKPGSTGVSPRIEKVNMALISEQKSMKDFLVSTFQVMRSDGIYVKILEEFHRLNNEDQGLMLEETARLPENVYLILTTTHVNQIIKEIESRCLTFNLGRLNRGETRILVDKVNRRIKLRPEDYDLVYQKTVGIPRDTVILMEFLAANDPSSEEIDALLGNIGKEVFIDLFRATSNFRLYIETVDNLLSAYPGELILKKLSDFLTQTVFALEGGIYEFISKDFLASLPFKELETVYKILKLIESTEPIEHSMKVMFLRMRRFLAPAMTIHEQKISAEITSSVKGFSAETPVAKLTPFKRE